MLSRLLPLIKLLFLIFFSKNAYAINCSPTPATYLSLPKLIQEHTAPSVGKPLGDDKSHASYSHLGCEITPGMGKLEISIDAPQAPSMAKGIFASPIPGVGFKIKVHPTVGHHIDGQSTLNLHKNCQYGFLTNSTHKLCDVDYNAAIPGEPVVVWNSITYTFYQTSPVISPGSTTQSKIGQIKLYNSDGTYSSQDLFFNASTLVLGTCDLTTKSIIIDMPRGDAKHFDGIGSASSESGSEKAFNIPLKCNAGTRVNLQIDGDAEDASLGLLKLSSGARTASGAAIQLLHKNSPIKLGELFFIDTVKTAGTFRIPMSARYIQTQEQIKPGKANSTATITLKYL
ncbi:fimbrial protein [Ectopseudomonas mendocina]|uniref:Fimbrial protein n=1 Tax=Ectopseudomonas mendocina TaxID=300 RepID=A0ABZ2RJ97_ECTME